MRDGHKVGGEKKKEKRRQSRWGNPCYQDEDICSMRVCLGTEDGRIDKMACEIAGRALQVAGYGKRVTKASGDNGRGPKGQSH